MKNEFERNAFRLFYQAKKRITLYFSLDYHMVCRDRCSLYLTAHTLKEPLYILFYRPANAVGIYDFQNNKGGLHQQR